MKNLLLLFLIMIFNTTSLHAVCDTTGPFDWRGASVYFVITDRFCNGDSTNDINYGRIVDYGT